MLSNKSLSRDIKPSTCVWCVALRVGIVSVLLVSLTSCATSIPGLDRVLFSNSSAQVGPVVAVEEAYPTGDAKLPQGSAAELQNESAALELKGETKSDALDNTQQQSNSSEPVVESKPSLETSPALATEPETASAEIAIEYGSVSGTVVLLGDENQPLQTTGTMITLTPQTMVDEVSDRPAQVHIIDMKDKTYLPRYSTIQAGDQVVFANKDNIQHNVFSSSGNNAFDLGTYGAGLKRAVTLKESGIVKIYCNIHSEMATFVAVGDQGLSVRVDDEGRYSIDKVLPGTYEVSIWNIRGESKRIVEIKANEATQLVDRIDTTVAKVEPHKNKFGGDYSKNSTLFEDEFY